MGLNFIRSCSTGKGLEEADIAVAVMDYTLAPQGVYPAQLIEVALGVQYLFEKVKARPGNLLVGGDSAGGTLRAQLLTHLVRPHPKGVKIELEEPLVGAFLVSPWVGGCCDETTEVNRSWQENGKRDMLPLGVARELERLNFSGTL
jgi:acetyl esterase/lipase